MSEESKKTDSAVSEKSWFGWLRNVVAAVVGAVISCAATVGFLEKSEADAAKERVDSLVEQSDKAYVQMVDTIDTIKKAKELIKEKKYLEALALLDSIKDSGRETVDTIVELKKEIVRSSDDLEKGIEKKKKEAAEKKKEIESAVEDVKKAVKDRPDK